MRKSIPQLPSIRIARFYSGSDASVPYRLCLLIILQLRTNRWRLFIGEDGEYHFSRTRPIWDGQSHESALLRLLMVGFRSRRMLQSTIRRDRMDDRRYDSENMDLEITIN